MPCDLQEVRASNAKQIIFSAQLILLSKKINFICGSNPSWPPKMTTPPSVQFPKYLIKVLAIQPNDLCLFLPTLKLYSHNIQTDIVKYSKVQSLFKEVSPHSAVMLVMTLVCILDNDVGWGKRIIHVYKNKLSLWDYLLTPFNQISLLNFSP